MRQTVRYQILSIPQKLKCDVRIVIDDKNNDIYISNLDGNKSTSISFFPFIGISIVKPNEIGEDGRRITAAWNINDHLSLTKYNFPIFLRELRGIYDDMKTPELFTYHGKRLELNEELASKFRRVLVCGATTIEMSTIVAVQPDDSRLEAVKLKFNNESSTVVLTVNDMTSLLYTLEKLDVDNLAFSMYNQYIEKVVKGNQGQRYTPSVVDITPKEDIEKFI